MSLGDRIRERRVKLGFTQDQLADLIGMKRANIAAYEANRNSPPSEVLPKLADALKCSADYLLGMVDEPYHIVMQDVSGLSDEEQTLLRMFLIESEEVLRVKGKISEEKLNQVLAFMKFTFMEDLAEEKSKNILQQHV